MENKQVVPCKPVDSRVADVSLLFTLDLSRLAFPSALSLCAKLSWAATDRLLLKGHYSRDNFTIWHPQIFILFYFLQNTQIILKMWIKGV